MRAFILATTLVLALLARRAPRPGDAEAGR